VNTGAQRVLWDPVSDIWCIFLKNSREQSLDEFVAAVYNAMLCIIYGFVEFAFLHNSKVHVIGCKDIASVFWAFILSIGEI